MTNRSGGGTAIRVRRAHASTVHGTRRGQLHRVAVVFEAVEAHRVTARPCSKMAAEGHDGDQCAVAMPTVGTDFGGALQPRLSTARAPPASVTTRGSAWLASGWNVTSVERTDRGVRRHIKRTTGANSGIGEAILPARTA